MSFAPGLERAHAPLTETCARSGSTELSAEPLLRGVLAIAPGSRIEGDFFPIALELE